MANDVAAKPDGELSKFEQFIRFAQQRAELDAGFETAEELAKDQVIKIADANSVDDLFGAMKTAGLIGLRDLDNGTELEIREYRLVKSSRDDLSGRMGVFAIISATDLSTGETLALDTSIERILGFLLKCDQLSAFPVQVRVEKKSTMSGNEMITFARPPVRAK